jgi:Cellulose biosynthesis protein BcsS
MRRVFPALAAFAAMAMLGIVDSGAADLDADVRPSTHYLLFSGVDLWRSGGFAHGGLLWSPHGLAQDGFTLKLLLGGGFYRYRSGTSEVSGASQLAAVMPGWRWRYQRLEVLVYGGLDLQQHRLHPDDPGNTLRGRHAGARVGADLWWEPSASTMASASVSLSSIGRSYWARAAYGWHLLDRCYVGPELHAMGSGSYWQFRAGLHATALRTGAFEWSAGAGLVKDSDRRVGLYGRLGVLMRR